MSDFFSFLLELSPDRFRICLSQLEPETCKGLEMSTYQTAYIGAIGNKKVISYMKSLNKKFIADVKKFPELCETAIGRILFELPIRKADATHIIPGCRNAHFQNGSEFLHPQVASFGVVNSSAEKIEREIFFDVSKLDDNAVVISEWFSDFGSYSGVRIFADGQYAVIEIERVSNNYFDLDKSSGRKKQMKEISKLRKDAVKELILKKPSFNKEMLFNFLLEQ